MNNTEKKERKMSARRAKYMAQAYVGRPYTTKQQLIAYLQKLERQFLWHTDMYSKLVSCVRAVLRQDWTKAYERARELEPHLYGTTTGKHAHWSIEFKMDMMRRYEYCKKNNLSISAMAKRMGVETSILWSWVKRYHKTGNVPRGKSGLDITISREDYPTVPEMAGYVEKLTKAGGDFSITEKVMHDAVVAPKLGPGGVKSKALQEEFKKVEAEDKGTSPLNFMDDLFEEI